MVGRSDRFLLSERRAGRIEYLHLEASKEGRISPNWTSSAPVVYLHEGRSTLTSLGPFFYPQPSFDGSIIPARTTSITLGPDHGISAPMLALFVNLRSLLLPFEWQTHDLLPQLHQLHLLRLGLTCHSYLGAVSFPAPRDRNNPPSLWEPYFSDRLVTTEQRFCVVLEVRQTYITRCTRWEAGRQGDKAEVRGARHTI